MWWFGRGELLKFDKRFCHKSWHTRVQCSCIVIPFEIDAHICFPFPVDRDDVVILQGFFRLVGVFIPHELDAKFINNQSEGDRPQHMLPEPRRKLAREVSDVAHSFEECVSG